MGLGRRGGDEEGEKGSRTIRHDLASVLLYALEQRRPSHQIGQVEVQVVVLGVRVQVAEVEGEGTSGD